MRRGSPRRARTVTALAAAFGLLAAAGAGGCGGGGDEDASNTPASTATTAAKATRPASTPPRPLEGCRSAGSGWRPLRTSGHYGAVAAHMGQGRLGVVFADDSIDDPCEWSREARALARRGYAVAVFQTGAGVESRQAVRVGAALRARGARRIVLLGASVGARAVLEAGAQHPRGVVGLVALSAERRIGSNPSDLLPVARDVRLPVLSIGSRRDPLTKRGKDTMAWDRALARDQMLLVSGGKHGVDLLAGRDGSRVRANILGFLRSLD